MRKLWNSLLLMVVLVMVFGCNNSVMEAKQVVTAYNDAVIMAHRTGDTTQLKNVAGEKEARNLGLVIETKRNAGLVLEATLESLEIISAKKENADRMTVETRERWKYYDRHLKPGMAPSAVVNVNMSMSYNCKKVSDKWKVMEIRTLASKSL